MTNISSSNFFTEMQNQDIQNNGVNSGNNMTFQNPYSNQAPGSVYRRPENFNSSIHGPRTTQPLGGANSQSVYSQYGMISSVIGNSKQSYEYLVEVVRAFMPKKCYVSSDNLADIFSGKVRTLMYNDAVIVKMNYVPGLTSRQDLLDRCIRHPVARNYVYYYWKKEGSRFTFKPKLLDREFLLGILCTFDTIFVALYEKKYSDHLKRKRFGIIDEVNVDVDAVLTQPGFMNLQSLRNNGRSSTTIVSRMTKRYLLDNDTLYRQLHQNGVRLSARDWTRISQDQSQLNTYALMVNNVTRNEVQSLAGSGNSRGSPHLPMPREFGPEMQQLIPNDRRARLLINLNNILAKINVSVARIDYSDYSLQQLDDIHLFVKEALETIALRIQCPINTEYSYQYLSKLVSNLLIKD